MAGRVDVDEMLDELTPREFNEWRAADQLEPIGVEWLAKALSLLLLQWLSAESDATLEDLLEGFGFRPYEPPLSEADADAAEAAIIASMGAK